MKKILKTLIVTAAAILLPVAAYATTFVVPQGGTGASSFGQGWVYSDGLNGGFNPLNSSTSPTVNYITATSTTATSTFANGINITKGCFAVNSNCIGPFIYPATEKPNGIRTVFTFPSFTSFNNPSYVISDGVVLPPISDDGTVTNWTWNITNKQITLQVPSINEISLVRTTSLPPGCLGVPSIPTGFAIDTVTNTTVKFHWNSATASCGVYGYYLYDVSGPRVIAFDLSTTTSTISFRVIGLTPSTAYTFAVTAVDFLGDESGPSSLKATTTAATGSLPSVQVSVPSASADGNILIASTTGNYYPFATSSLGLGTVTSVATGNGLTGGPITTSGTISLNTAGLLTNGLVTYNGTNLVATGTPNLTAGFFTATTSTASSFPYASSTAISATTLCLTGDICRTTWPTGAAYPFTPTTNYAVTNQATTGIAWFQNGMNASSTSHFVNASTTLLSSTGATVLGTASGNVGIGTSSPYQKLSVSGNTVINGAATVYTSSIAPGTVDANQWIKNPIGAVVNRFEGQDYAKQEFVANHTSGPADGGKWQMYARHDGSNPDNFHFGALNDAENFETMVWDIFRTGTDVTKFEIGGAVFQVDGKEGVNTGSPVARLDVRGADNGGSGPGEDALYTFSGKGDVNQNGGNNTVISGLGGDSNDFSKAGTGGNIYLEGGDGGANNDTGDSGDGGLVQITGGAGGDTFGASQGNGGNIRLQAGLGGTNGNIVLNDLAGNVGVGNSSPAYKLDVAGDANVTGCYRINGSCVNESVETASISGGITGIGCDTVDTTGLSSLASSTAFVTTPETFPGNGVFTYSMARNSTTIRTYVCSDVTVTPNASKYIVKIIR